VWKSFNQNQTLECLKRKSESPVSRLPTPPKAIKHNQLAVVANGGGDGNEEKRSRLENLINYNVTSSGLHLIEKEATRRRSRRRNPFTSRGIFIIHSPNYIRSAAQTFTRPGESGKFTMLSSLSIFNSEFFPPQLFFVFFRRARFGRQQVLLFAAIHHLVRH